MTNKANAIPYSKTPDQINPAMLDDIAARVSDAMPADKKREKDYIRGLIKNIISEHYHGKNETV